MPLRTRDIIGPLILAAVLFGLVAIILIGNVPTVETA
jgi:hypothetical protein